MRTTTHQIANNKAANSSGQRIVVIGALPPPTGGAAKNTDTIANAFEAKGSRVKRLNTMPDARSSHANGIHFHMRRVKRCLINGYWLLSNLRANDVVYIVPDGGLGIWYNLLYAIVVAMRTRGPVYLHHRNFVNMVKRQPVLALIVRLLGRRLRQIFLEEEMKRLFVENYGAGGNGIVLRNAATCDVDIDRTTPSVNKIATTIGYLSNLNREKGFFYISELFLSLSKIDSQLRFSIGGAPSDKETDEQLQKLRTELKGRLDYAGHLSGEEKSKFFRNVDIFVFPTIFQKEAQPNVLYEAMAAGAFIISTRHACIPYMLDDAPHILVSSNPKKIHSELLAASKLACELTSKENGRLGMKSEVMDAFANIRRNASEVYEVFLNEVTANEVGRK